MSKDEIKEKIAVGFYFGIGLLLPLVIILLAIFYKSPYDSKLIIDDKTSIEVCGSEFMLSEYTEGEEFNSYVLSDNLAEVCSEYYADILREEIEEEVKEELKDK